MRLKTKIIIIVLTSLVGMLVLPMVCIRVLKGDSGMGFAFLQFFVINPLICILLSIISGTDVKHFWFIPFFVAAVFPFMFSLAVTEMVWDLFFYSVIYLIIGYIVMFITYLITRLSIKN